MAPTSLFLRDDDIGPMDEAARQFVDIFLERGLPVSYQLIPARLTAECARWLAGLAAAHPGLVQFGQHGHTHEMEVNGRREYYEFGPERTLDQQQRIIATGRARLQSLLGPQWSGRLFTPPRHRYDRNTLKALAAEGFSILSASAWPGAGPQAAYRLGRALGLTRLGRGGIPRHGARRPESPLLELSVSVAVDHGPPVRRTVDEVIGEIAAARRRTPIVGLMFHHNAWKGPGGGDFLKRLADALLRLPDTSVEPIETLADRLSA